MPAEPAGDWCLVDECPSVICGGPHFVVATDIGAEILLAGQRPIGRPREQQTAATS